jgi:hypothetical protein
MTLGLLTFGAACFWAGVLYERFKVLRKRGVL